MDLLGNILIGAAGSIVAIILIAVLARTRAVVNLLGSTYGLATRLREGGIAKLHLSRDDYGRSLRTYLSRARHSIGIVSISLKVTHDESDVAGLFRQRISENPDFRISVSLLDPASVATECAAQFLNIASDQLRVEIREMIRLLTSIRDALPDADRPRLQILTHDSLPMGSAILLDATPDSGTIQVETKLYRAPRSESFSYEVAGQSPFFARNYRSWMKVLDESRPPSNP